MTIEMNKPLVSIIMGSDSDLPVMEEAAKVLEEFGIPHEKEIVSAHRTPDRMEHFAKTAIERGVKVIIAGAGGAAHLPGMTASYTVLPVIGVPVKTSTMEGIDSLLSIAQMPGGIPVATVAINGAKNAGLLAIEILGTSMPDLQDKLQKYKKSLEEMVLEKNKKLVESGE